VFAEDRGMLTRIASAAARTLEARRLSGEAARARELAELDRLRSALLAAVGHDLRTPLASIKAAVSSLRAPDIEFPPEVTAELLATVEESTDRLDALVENLLSMSRLNAGAVIAHAAPVPIDAVVATALLHLPADGVPVEVDVPDDLPLVHVDAGLVERVVANLVTNARAAAPADRPVRVVGRRDGDRVRVAVIDHGPGVPDADKDRIFTPFQRLGDRTADGGLGLGLAIARGFAEAVDGTLTPTDTPGGGLTMTLRIPLAAPEHP
jgi:two-component system sensor histidine kinase KdpD